MRIRNRKPLHYNPRFKHKYKIIAQLRYNLLNIQKVYNFHYLKWRFLRLKRLRRFKKRLLTQTNTEKKNYGVSKRDPMKHPKFSYSFRSRMRLKRCLLLWYRIKRIKMLGPRFFKSYKIRENNAYFSVYNILGFIARFERRIDVIIFRFFFFSSLYFVQKLIGLKKIKINYKTVSYYNIYLNRYDTIQITKPARKYFLTLLKKMFRSPYKPKFLMLLQLKKNIEINYNILTLYYYQPLHKLTSLAGYFPFYFNYKVLDAYFWQHH